MHAIAFRVYFVFSESRKNATHLQIVDKTGIPKKAWRFSKEETPGKSKPPKILDKNQKYQTRVATNSNLASTIKYPI